MSKLSRESMKKLVVSISKTRTSRFHRLLMGVAIGKRMKLLQLYHAKDKLFILLHNISTTNMMQKADHLVNEVNHFQT